MPYIPRNQRAPRASGNPHTGGELSFCIAREVDYYILYRDLSYDTISDVLAALEGVKAEFYRRFAAPYEESKRATNGEAFVETAAASRAHQRERFD